MGPKEMIDRIVALPPHAPGRCGGAPVELVAIVARMGRCLRQSGKETLADFSRGSLSTAEWIERVEPGKADSLDRIALGYGSSAPADQHLNWLPR